MDNIANKTNINNTNVNHTNMLMKQIEINSKKIDKLYNLPIIQENKENLFLEKPIINTQETNSISNPVENNPTSIKLHDNINVAIEKNTENHIDNSKPITESVKPVTTIDNKNPIINETFSPKGLLTPVRHNFKEVEPKPQFHLRKLLRNGPINIDEIY